MSIRQQRVAELIQGELSTLLLREVHDPRLRLVSIARVDVSPDLTNAKVVLSTLNEEIDQSEVLEAAEKARGFLRTRLARRLKNMRVVPALSFEIDQNAEYSQRMSDLLEDL